MALAPFLLHRRIIEMRKTIKFLTEVFSKQCEPGDYVILSVKSKTIPWKDCPIKYGHNFQKQLEQFFDQYPPEDNDLYWSPMPYSKPQRKIQFSLDTKFLAQDIDEFEEPDKLKPKPTYLWESSPNKYQGLWELDRYIEEAEYTPLNKSLAKHIGCDDCFDFTHVYRIPGTINHKYRNSPEVQLPVKNDVLYKPKKLREIVGAPESTKSKPESTKSGKESSSITERKIYAKYPIPQRVKDLLAMETLVGVDRSSTIWYVEHKLHELGMNPNEIIHLIKNSVFNKYKGRSDEDSRIRTELEKIISGDIPEPTDNVDSSLKVVEYDDVMGNSSGFEGWLVKGFWGRRSHGIVAGMPKCFKSTMVHDLAISVASGEPFLGRFPVIEPGPVIVVQNENADYIMKDRTEKVIMDRGLVGEVKKLSKSTLNIEFPPSLPITFINQQGFTLTNREHQLQLENLIKEKNPVLVILDPLYLMFDGDLNSSKELNPVLNWLLYLKNEYKTSVMLIHHYNKGSQQGSAKGGARMAGSIMLYGWVESAWYLSKNGDEEETTNLDDSMELSQSKGSSSVTMTREFRMSGNYPEIDIHFNLGEIGNPLYSVDVTAAGSPHITVKTIEDEVIQLLSTNNSSMTKRAICDQLGVKLETLRKVLDELIKMKKIIATNGGYTISK